LPCSDLSARRIHANESPTKSRPLQRSGETDETSETGETKTRSSGALLTLAETHETFASRLPRWGSRVRIPSSAPETALSTCTFSCSNGPAPGDLPMSCRWLAHDRPRVRGHGTGRATHAIRGRGLPERRRRHRHPH